MVVFVDLWGRLEQTKSSFVFFFHVYVMLMLVFSLVYAPRIEIVIYVICSIEFQ